MIAYFYNLLPVATIVALFSVHENIDPLYGIVVEFTPFRINSIFVTIIRLTLLFLSATEVVRMICISIVIFIVCIKVLTDLFKTLLLIHNNLEQQKVIELWKHTEIVIKILKPATDIMIAIVLGICFVISVLTNFCTIKLGSVVPMYIYVLFPHIAIVVMGVFTLAISQTSKLYNYSSELLWQLKISSRGRWDIKGRKCHSKLLKSFQPLAVCAGINGYQLFVSKQSLMLTYCYAVVDYTITALLSIPVEKLL